jgi:hypothetical protein
MCEALLFLKKTMDSTKNLTTAGLRAAARGLGSSWAAPMALTSTFASDAFFDGAAAVRYMDFKDNCVQANGQTYGCFQYVGATVRAAR